jgi:hypothetical protein
MPDQGWGMWGTDRERGYTSWDRDEYGGSDDDQRWRGRDYSR